MDFSHTPEQEEAARLAGSILTDRCTPERLREVEQAGDGRFDAGLWSALGEAGLIGIALPEEYGGGGTGFLELCSVLVEAGRRVAPVPLASHAVAAAAIARFGTAAQRQAWLSDAASGACILAAATHGDVDARPEGDGWRLDGAASVVLAGDRAGLLVVPARTPDGTVVLLVEPSDPGVTLEIQRVTGGDHAALVSLAGVTLGADRVLAGTDVADWLEQHLTVAWCAEQLGIVEGALALTASYSRTREQFGRPIGTFQAVSQRLADGYIDVLGARLTLWQAAWRLAEELPAETEVATAALWAADAGHRLAHTTVHVHGGVGIDLDGEAHRFFTAAKRHELLLGGTTLQARRIGAALAAADA